MSDASVPFDGPIRAQLPTVVRRVIGLSPATVLGWQGTVLQGGFGSLSGESAVYLLTGTARTGGVDRAWSVVLKLLRPGPSDPNRSHVDYPMREYLLYRSGRLAALPAGVRAPGCFGCAMLPDGSAAIWLEHVPESADSVWPVERWALAARHLGRFNGAYLSGRPLPREPWLGGRRLRTWLDRFAPALSRMEVAADDPDLRRFWPWPVVEEIRRVWARRLAICDALERLPPAFCHFDAIRRNLISSRSAAGADETVAVDWGSAGYGAAGEEVGQTYSVAAAFFHLDPADLPSLDGALFESYLDGLRDAGWRGDAAEVRFAFTAHAALRNLFNMVGTSRPTPEQRAALHRNQSRGWEELAERRAAIRPHLLRAAREAMAWLDRR